jgi:glycine oxidase
MKNFDLSIIGNGVIGTLAAIKIKKKYPKLKIALIGNINRFSSASVAAGAMANVYAEIENGPDRNANEARYLEIGLKGRDGWKKFFNEFNLNKKIITCNDTIVFLKSSASDFERSNFDSMERTAKSDNVCEMVNSRLIKETFFSPNISVEKALKLLGEFSICTISLFNELDLLLKKLNIYNIFQDVTKVNENHNHLNIELSNKDVLSSKRIIVAAGAMSSSIFSPKYKILPMLQGVGTAIVINNKSQLPSAYNKYVIRTVNRGGAQCGLHTVPRSDGTLYLGAGNYIARPGKAFHRLETIKYLFSMFENEMVGKSVSYHLLGSLCLGSRPRSFDGFPMIGAHSKDERIYFATGTNRVGLTWAPRIAEDILDWMSSKNQSNLFDGWNPDRDPISFGTEEHCIDYFRNSRISAAFEHGMLNPKNKKECNIKNSEFILIAKDFIKKIKKKYKTKDNMYINPDNWNALL